MSLPQELTLSSSSMKYTRIYSIEDGTSRFEDIEVPLVDQGDIGWLSKTFNAKGVVFRHTPAAYDFDWHCAPQRQFVVMLNGAVEITVGDGSKRIFDTGDIILADDTTGQGHISRAVNQQPRASLFITLA